MCPEGKDKAATGATSRPRPGWVPPKLVHLPLDFCGCPTLLRRTMVHPVVCRRSQANDDVDVWKEQPINQYLKLIDT